MWVSWVTDDPCCVCVCVGNRGVCVQSPCYCIVMEYCPYGQLYEVLRDGKDIPPTLLVSWTKQIATGMSYLHMHKIIHRDLKSPKLVSTPLLLSLIPGRGGGVMSRSRSTPERTTCVKGRLSWCSWRRCVPAWGTDSEEEDAALSPCRLYSQDTPETVIIRYSEDMWPEADCDPRWWCTGFWASRSIAILSRNCEAVICMA